MKKEEPKKRRLDDPEEFDIIRHVYLHDRTPLYNPEDIDPEEWRDRQKKRKPNPAR